MGKYNIEYISNYYYKGTEVLKNKEHTRDKEKLQRLENFYTTARIYELVKNPIIGFEIKDLKKIHRYIFQDIYYFAGKFRIENISKGTTKFYPYNAVEEALIKILTELKNENYLVNENKDNFIERVSYYLTELNLIHPFREGNGRVLREFIRCLGLFNNYIIDWSLIEDGKFLNASIDSVKDYRNFIECIRKVII